MRTLEQRLRAVVTVASEGIWTIGADGRTTYVNPRMPEMLGYTPAQMQGRRFSEFVPPRQLPIAERGFDERRQGVPDRNEIELIRKDGSSIWIHYAGTPMSDGSRFIGALAVVTDITERRQNEMTIRQQAEALAQANRQKEEFLATLGHELRNALSPLVTAVKLLELKKDGPSQRERAVILRQCDHLTRLVGDISDVSRFGHGKFSIQGEPVNFAQVVREGCDIGAPLVARSAHPLDVHVPERLTIEGDGVRLRQVVVNLLTNAAKYTPDGGRITVTAEVEDTGAHAILRVRDNGVGILPEFLPVLFEPFSQSQQSRDRSDGGLGLGLAIVRGIVQAHDGTIDAHSGGAGQGSEFVVRLPVLRTSQIRSDTSYTRRVSELA
jgi:PAS domain S-box-containing protein